MATAISTIKFPELLFGFVAAIGVDLKPTIAAFRQYLEGENYDVIEIKATDAFNFLKNVVKPKKTLVSSPLKDRYVTHIAYGNQLRAYFDDDSVLAALTVGQVVRRRPSKTKRPDKETFSKTAYLLHQYKRREEVDLLRSVYGRLFFQVSVYSRRGARVDYLSRKFAESRNSAEANLYRADAENLVQQDEDEVEVAHGQRVGRIFHDADFIVNSDINTPNVNDQVKRFGELIFNSNCISPTKFEYGMFLAKAAALRTLDLSRQVGAAIFSQAGEIISLGSNEVPKALGGTYWSDDQFDDREYVRGYDSNDKRKQEILKGIIEAIVPPANREAVMKRKGVIDSQFMDALEYGRIVHAEMSAISDAARNGHAIRDSVLYSTTFPCHMCAKHIVASGISKVVFLEPYPKSLASDLHSDSIEIESSDRGQYSKFPAVRFEHFFGVTPRRYRELFERSKRKSATGEFQNYKDGVKRPFIDLKAPFYYALEQFVMGAAYEGLTKKLASRAAKKSKFKKKK
ncbi:MAG: anti-phage dCTP deaminase [Aestuariivirga sp.]